MITILVLLTQTAVDSNACFRGFVGLPRPTVLTVRCFIKGSSIVEHCKACLPISPFLQLTPTPRLDRSRSDVHEPATNAVREARLGI